MATGKVTFRTDTFKEEKSGREVPGVTLIIDGPIREVLDKIIASDPDQYKTYVHAVQDALFTGINVIATEIQKKENAEK